MAVPLLRAPTKEKLPYIAKSLHTLVMPGIRVTRGSASTICNGMM